MSRRRTGARLPALLLLLAGLGGALAGAGPAAAACPSPTFTVSPSEGRPNDGIQITGTNFYRSCTDSTTDQDEPDSGIRIVFVQGSSETLIGTARAGSDGRIEGQVFVPAKATAGPATVRAEGTNGRPAAAFTVTGGSTATTAAPTATSTTAKATTTTTARSTTTSTGEVVAITSTTFAPITTTTEAPDAVVGDESASADTDDDGGRPAVVLAAASLALAAGAAVFFLLYRIRRGPVDEV